MSDNRYLLVLTDKKYIRLDKIVQAKELKNFVVTPKSFDENFFEHAKNIDYNTIKTRGYVTDDSYFYILYPIKDFLKRDVGYYLVAQKIDSVNSSVYEVQKALYAMIIIMFLKTLIVLSSVYFITNRVVGRGVKKFKRYFKYYVDYTTLKRTRFEKSEVYINDEIGELLTMLNNSADDYKKRIESDNRVLSELQELTSEISLDDFSKRIESSSDNKLLMMVKDNINNMTIQLERSMENIIDILNRYSDKSYDEKIEIDPQLKSHIKEVMESINILGERLHESDIERLKNGKALNSEVESLNSSLELLVKRTKDQSISVSNTLKSIEDISELTKQNSLNASKMSKLGHNVKSLAKEGNRLTDKTSFSIEEIAQETKKIKEAVEIIEQILFQINILSLNAAVEAATAGEFGKCFAVVASEVRNLASKTSQASDEIKEIIEKAALKVEEGKANSIVMQEGYSELQSNISNTINLIDSVTTISKSQLDQTEHIRENIAHIDKATKQNSKEVSRVQDISKEVEKTANELLQEESLKECC